MQQLKAFTPYTPENPAKLALIDEFRVMFLRNEDGIDWYDARELFAKDTLKVGYDDTGRVRTFTTDIDAMMPVGLSVAEVTASEKNRRLTLGDDWFYKDGKLQQIRDYVAIATAERDRLMNEAAKVITPLQDAADVDLATGKELKKLKAWKIYRVLLNRIDVNAAPDIQWPVKPE